MGTPSRYNPWTSKYHTSASIKFRIDANDVVISVHTMVIWCAFWDGDGIVAVFSRATGALELWVHVV